MDATPACNCLAFQLGGTGIGAVIPTRSFSIKVIFSVMSQAIINCNGTYPWKVTQYTCDYPNLAPSGCVQFFFGSNMGQVQTFNYNNGAGQHLSDQDQVICVRYLRIWFFKLGTALNVEDFSMNCRRERSNCRWETLLRIRQSFSVQVCAILSTKKRLTHRICWYTVDPADFAVSGKLSHGECAFWQCYISAFFCTRLTIRVRPQLGKCEPKF